MPQKMIANTCLTINLNAIISNWKTLDASSAPKVKTGAVIKANAYGLGIKYVAPALAKIGVTSFFVAFPEEGIHVRNAVGPAPKIYVFSGFMQNCKKAVQSANLIPLLNSLEQIKSFQSIMPTAIFGLQLDTGMNRLGLEPAEFAQIRNIAPQADLIISHLACADDPNHPNNQEQLDVFHRMTDGLNVPKSLAATGGIFLGSDYHFDLCRPGIGLYGGLPFVKAEPVVSLSLPVIQIRDVLKGETVGYSATWQAKRDSKIATLAAGYADGLLRAMGNKHLMLYAGKTPCPLIGRVSMDLLTVDVTDLPLPIDRLHLLNSHQKIDDLATAASTIGYEILTALGERYNRCYIGI